MSRPRPIDAARPAIALALLLSACVEPEHGPPLSGHAVLLGTGDHTGISVAVPALGRETLTDRFGYFAFADVPADDYQVTAHHSGTRERDLVADVQHGPGSAPLLFSFSPVGRLTGTIRTRDGAPLVGAEVVVLGTDARTSSLEGGSFVIDPAPAGTLAVLGRATTFLATTVETTLAAGGSVGVELILEPSNEPDPYAGNRPPTISDIALAAAPDLSFPRPVPLLTTASGLVRRAALYSLTVTVDDPDADELRVYFSADRGTLDAPTGATVTWRAGAGTSTLVATVVDPFGGTASSRKVVRAAVDNSRGAGVFDGRVYYGERRPGDNADDTFDVFSYGLTDHSETRVVGTAMEEHAVQVVGDWLLYGSSEFVFVGPLVYRMAARHLPSGQLFGFGQEFDHDSTFEVEIDLYTQVPSLHVPYAANGSGTLAAGNGFFDILSDTAVPLDLGNAVFGPASHRSFGRDGNRLVWLAFTAEVFIRRGNGVAERLGSIPNGVGSAGDVAVHDGFAVILPQSRGPLYWLDLSEPTPSLTPLGGAVTSYATFAGRVAYVEQGPTSASVELVDLRNGAARTLTSAPQVARRIWFLDDDYVIWGDQGAEGQSFIALNSELLWVDEVD